jgi:Protein of unknown function (DUF998)
MTVAGVIALAALAATVAGLGYLHIAPTGLSPLRNAVSQYGITPFKAGYRAATIAFAAAGLALAVAVSQALHHRGNATIALLVVFAVARAAISWFPMDQPGTARTQTGGIHGLLAIAAFGSATAAAFRLASALSRQGAWHALAGTSRTLGWLMLVCLIAMALTRRFPTARLWFGAIERGFYVSAIAWFAVFAVAAVTHAH